VALRLQYLVFVRLPAAQTRPAEHGPSRAFWGSASSQMKVYGSASSSRDRNLATTCR
jgi:hypothetical protein